LESVEQFFPWAAARLATRQYARHAADSQEILPEEHQMERDYLRAQLSGMLPRAIRGSALVVLYSAFESTTLDFAKSLSADLRCPEFVPTATRGAFPKKASRYFEEMFRVRLFSDELEESEFEVLRTLRNSVVHQQSDFSRLPARIRNSISTSKFRLRSCHVFDGTWIPSSDCISAHGKLVRDWARLLSHRVFERTGIDAYL
jgi:hypothetical protein